MSDNAPPAALFILLPFVLVGFWAAVCGLLGWVSGWSRLGKSYRCAAEPKAWRYTWQSGSVGLVSYRNCLHIGVSEDGLFLSVPWVFRVGHPALFIPWAQIHNVQNHQLLWVRRVHFEVGDPALARIQLPEQAFESRPAAG